MHHGKRLEMSLLIPTPHHPHFCYTDGETKFTEKGIDRSTLT